MESFILVNPGLEELALQEISELTQIKGKVAGSGIIEIETKKEALVFLSCHSQSSKRILIALGKTPALKKINFSQAGWPDYFFPGASFKVEVEGVKGNERRIKIGKEIGSQVFLSVKKKLNFEPKIDLKKPDLRILVYSDGKAYFLGLDFCGFDLTRRDYRLFLNPSSLRGDLAYYLVRKSGFVKGEKLVVGFVKDGTIALEAALFDFNKTVNKNPFSFLKFPLFRDFGFIEDLKEQEEKKEKKEKNICGFDNCLINLRAAKKNAQLAGLLDLIELNKFDLDELDLKFKKNSVDRLIFHITKKDESKLNELYHQAAYVLKKKGTLLVLGRKGWSLTPPNKFKLVSSEEIWRGGSCFQVWVMGKR